MQARRPEGTKGRRGAQALRPRGAQGFTLVELLIVIAVLGLLIAMIVLGASKSIDRQKRSLTESIMSNVMLAIDQFKTEDTPFRRTYNDRSYATFGALPPYQLARPSGNARSVAQLLEPQGLQPGGAGGGLKDRLARDIFNAPAVATDANRINLANDALPALHDDIRALYIYLQLYARATLSQVPQNAIQPLTNGSEFINPGSNASDETSRVQVFGIVDGWGVPLDYMLYLKLEWGQVVDPGSGQLQGGVRVVDRIPVLVSRGVSPEVFAAQVAAYQANSNPGVFDKRSLIFSPAFPTPPANVDADGVFQGNNSGSNGWVRARALGDFFGYVPSQDN